MSWLAVKLAVNAPGVDTLSDALLQMGALSVEVTDADAGTSGEHPLFSEPDERGAPVWNSSIVTALFNECDDIAANVGAALTSAGVDPACDYELESVADRDWV